MQIKLFSQEICISKSFLLSIDFIICIRMWSGSVSYSTVDVGGDNKLKMIIGSHNIPKTNNSLTALGKDAHFIDSYSQSFGIADGVDGWIKDGIDSGEYSRQLMKNAHRLFIQSSGWRNEKAADVYPLTILTKAFRNTRVKGSSTACIVRIKDDHLYAVNVGDSGFVQIRDGKVIYTSPIQNHYFNCPYQLSCEKDNNDLSSAAKIKRLIKPGDIIVAGTDGFFLNVNEEEISKLIRNRTKSPKILARTMAIFALEKAKDTCARTPRVAAGERVVDDITVVVAYITPSQCKWKRDLVSPPVKKVFSNTEIFVANVVAIIEWIIFLLFFYILYWLQLLGFFPFFAFFFCVVKAFVFPFFFSFL